MSRRNGQSLGSLLRCQRGTAIVEFAIAAPLLVLLLLGLLSVAQAIAVSGKLETAAATMADIIAQEKAISTADLNNMVIAGQQILYPDKADSGTFGGHIVLVQFKPVGTGYQASLGWQYNFGTSPGSAPSGADLTALAQPGVSVVLVSLTYKFRPTIVNPFFDHIDFTKSAVARPRVSDTITRS